MPLDPSGTDLTPPLSRRCALRPQQRQWLQLQQVPEAQRGEKQLVPQVQAAPATSDAELRADGVLMAAAALAPLLLDVGPAAAGNPLLTGKTVSVVH